MTHGGGQSGLILGRGPLGPAPAPQYGSVVCIRAGRAGKPPPPVATAPHTDPPLWPPHAPEYIQLRRPSRRGARNRNVVQRRPPTVTMERGALDGRNPCSHSVLGIRHSTRRIAARRAIARAARTGSAWAPIRLPSQRQVVQAWGASGSRVTSLIRLANAVPLRGPASMRVK